MAESPDYQPIAFSPYPPSPATYTAASATGTATVGSPVTVNDFSTASLWLVKSCHVSATVYLSGAVATEKLGLALQTQTGLNGVGPGVTLDQGQATLLPGGIGVAGGAAYIQLETPTPLVIQGHNGAGVQLLQVALFGAADGVADVRAALLAWPLN